MDPFYGEERCFQYLVQYIAFHVRYVTPDEDGEACCWSFVLLLLFISSFSSRLHTVDPIHYGILWKFIPPWNDLVIVFVVALIQRRNNTTSSLFRWTAQYRFFFSPQKSHYEKNNYIHWKMCKWVTCLHGTVFVFLFWSRWSKENMTWIFHEGNRDLEKTVFLTFWWDKLNHNTVWTLYSVTLLPHYHRAVTLHLTHIGL